MIILPKIRGFICTTAHPVGCSKVVDEQIQFVKSQGSFTGPCKVLVIGASTGYGLASRITATYGSGAKTIGVFYERGADDKRTATAGWYNSAAFERQARSDGYYAKSVNGDAFSTAVKEETLALIKQDLQQIDLIVYSLASPRRQHPWTHDVYSSVLKPIGRPYTSKTVDAFRAEVKEITLEPADEAEIAHTIAVMGGEDWEMWIDMLASQNLLAPGVKTVAYSYLGPAVTHDIYKHGTIGKAKEHLKSTADMLNARLASLNGSAMISVDKAVVTQASAAIPVVPLYIAILFKLMKERGTHEGCIEQMVRLFKDHLYAAKEPPRDAEGFIRLDNLEMDADLQQQITNIWPTITTENVRELTDLHGYCTEFNRLFGFNVNGIDYNADVDPNVIIPSLGADHKSS